MEREFGLSLVLFLLVLSGFVADSCSAATVWSDDFNDGDFDGWVLSGNFSAEEYTMKGVSADANYAFVPSTVARGTWSFDLYFTNYGGGRVYFMFTFEGAYGYDFNAPTNDLIELN